MVSQQQSLGIWGIHMMVPLFASDVNALVIMLANVMGEQVVHQPE